MANQFRIGKSGPTILQGTIIPVNSNGNNGDLYVQTGSTPKLYIKQTTGWIVSGDPTFGFTRQVISTTGTTVLNSVTTYAGVNVGNTATVQLMTGTSGKTVTIKDESGSASSNVITVIAQSGYTIDGQTSWNIDVNYGTLTLVFGSTEWYIVSSITSAPFDQIKL
jgi:DUF4097 and DUF4098 domain-containing protein YvlB